MPMNEQLIEQRFVRAGAGLLLMFVVIMISACTSDKTDGDNRPLATATPFYVAWQRPQVPISQEAPVVRLSGMMQLHQSTVNAVAFSASGTRLATVAADRTLAVWNLANGETLFVRGDVAARWVFFGPDDDTVITVDGSGLTRVWAMNMAPPRELEPIESFAGHPTTAAPIVVQSPDRTLLAYGAENGGVALWNMRERQMVANFQAHREAVGHLTFSPDGLWLATVGTDRSVRVWSVPDGDLVHNLIDADAEEIDVISTRAVFSPESDLLAVATEQGIRVWNLADGSEAYIIYAARHAASSAIVFSGDGNLLVGCGTQPLVGVWNARTGEQYALLPLPGQSRTCANAVFSPDGTLLLTLPSPGQDLYLWNLARIMDDVPADQKQLQRADRHGMGLPPGVQFFDIMWSEDGRFILVLDEQGPVYVLSAVS